MEAQHQMLRIEGDRDVLKTKQATAAAAGGGGGVSPAPSASTSPSHEFSFAIALHPPAAKVAGNKTKSSPPPFAAAIDLSPADEIFFHGHLLPLHLLSHLPVSPRSSTNSLDSFTLPIKELLQDHNNNNIIKNGDDDHGHGHDHDHNHHLRRHDDHESRHVLEGKERGKSKSFSLFAMPKWRKGGGHDQHKGEDDQQTQKRKSKFELLKRYVRFVKPFLSLRNGQRSGNSDEFLRQQPYSYSGNLRVKNKRNLMRGRRGEFSAPASMRTSPANSGLLLVASGTSTPTAKNDSTMEELQAAIQAAIAHCKKSIAAEDKIKLPS